MFNITEAVQLHIAAEHINTSRNLTDEEKIELLTTLSASLVTDMPGYPGHLKIFRASIERMTRDERARIAARAEKQGRKAEGVPNEAPVVTERAEESEARQGPTEGVKEQAEDGRGFDTPRTYAPKPTHRKGKAQTKA